MKLFLLDNYDSFTYNVVQLLGTLGVKPLVRRNTDIDIDGVKKFNPDRIIISPGPMRPENHPLIFELIGEFFDRVPLLGICLGMQAINQFFKGGLKQAPVPVHGKTSFISHTGEGIFKGVPRRFLAARYHSLIICNMPKVLKETAKTDDNIPMAVEHAHYPVFGVQFHPESYLSQYGKEILSNFLNVKKINLHPPNKRADSCCKKHFSRL